MTDNHVGSWIVRNATLCCGMLKVREAASVTWRGYVGTSVQFFFDSGTTLKIKIYYLKKKKRMR